MTSSVCISAYESGDGIVTKKQSSDLIIELLLSVIKYLQFEACLHGFNNQPLRFNGIPSVRLLINC